MTALKMLLVHGDREVPVGGNCTAISLSRRAAGRLREAGTPAAMLDRVTGRAAVIAPDGAVITVMHARARWYRRGWK
jgi:hypothetical protein